MKNSFPRIVNIVATGSFGKPFGIEKEIEKTDSTIDQIVYKLYGLTPMEIKVVEGDG